MVVDGGGWGVVGVDEVGWVESGWEDGSDLNPRMLGNTISYMQ